MFTFANSAHPGWVCVKPKVSPSDVSVRTAEVTYGRPWPLAGEKTTVRASPSGILMRHVTGWKIHERHSEIWRNLLELASSIIVKRKTAQ